MALVDTCMHMRRMQADNGDDLASPSQTTARRFVPATATIASQGTTERMDDDRIEADTVRNNVYGRPFGLANNRHR